MPIVKSAIQINRFLGPRYKTKANFEILAFRTRLNGTVCHHGITGCAGRHSLARLRITDAADQVSCDVLLKLGQNLMGLF